MSAVSNLTYVWLFDNNDAVNPDKASANYIFSNYDEAMSWSQFIVVNANSQDGVIVVYVWNYNGGSGLWIKSGGNPVFNPKANRNWP